MISDEKQCEQSSLIQSSTRVTNTALCIPVLVHTRACSCWRSTRALQLPRHQIPSVTHKNSPGRPCRNAFLVSARGFCGSKIGRVVGLRLGLLLEEDHSRCNHRESTFPLFCTKSPGFPPLGKEYVKSGRIMFPPSLSCLIKAWSKAALRQGERKARPSNHKVTSSYSSRQRKR